MKPIIIGDKDAHICLVQAVDEHDENLLEKEYELIKGQNPEERILLAAVRVDSWNHDLSPWPAAPVFGKEGFGDGAPETLRYILQTLLPMVQKDWLSASIDVKYVIGGYSLAGLFALWASCQTNAFSACMAASPSVWFPGGIDSQAEHPQQSDIVYLSLGDKEERARNPLMSQVGNCIRRQAALMAGKTTVLQWNEGNHFKDSEIRTAKGFVWCIQELRKKKPEKE